MTVHESDTVTLSVTLTIPELNRAARLGGWTIALDDHPIDDSDIALDWVLSYAAMGVIRAIYESFDREYPAHYPEDADADIWEGLPQW